jgi:phage tail tape-measure protein
MSEEMRQLAEAGIPAYDILQEKLGLTYKQLQNLGDEAIPASVAINALVDGITERFGG